MGNLIFKTDLFNGRHTVAAAYDADRVALCNGFGHSFRTFAERIHFKYAHRPVPDHQLGVFYRVCIQFAGLRPDIQRHVILVQVIQCLYFIYGIRLELRSHHQIHRQQDLDILYVSFRHDAFGFFNLVLLHQGLAHGDAPGCQEGVGHAAADEQCVHFAQQVDDHTDLIRYFCATDDRGKRMRRIGYGTADEADFFFQQEACRAGQETGHAFHRGMGPVGYAEAVIYIQFCQRCQFLRKAQVVLFFFFMIPQVFQQQYRTGLQFFRSFFRRRPDAVFRKGNRFPQQFFQMLCHRFQGVFGIGLSLGTSQMTH